MLIEKIDVASYYPNNKELSKFYCMYPRGSGRLNAPTRISFSYDKSAGAYKMFYKMLLYLEAVGLTLNTEMFDDGGYVIVMNWHKNRVWYILLSFEKLNVANNFKVMI